MMIGKCDFCGIEDFVNQTSRGLVCWDCVSKEEADEMQANEDRMSDRSIFDEGNNEVAEMIYNENNGRPFNPGYEAYVNGPDDSEFAWDTDEEAEEHAADDYESERRIIAENARLEAALEQVVMDDFEFPEDMLTVEHSPDDYLEEAKQIAAEFGMSVEEAKAALDEMAELTEARIRHDIEQETEAAYDRYARGSK